MQYITIADDSLKLENATKMVNQSDIRLHCGNELYDMALDKRNQSTVVVHKLIEITASYHAMICTKVKMGEYRC